MGRVDLSDLDRGVSLKSTKVVIASNSAWSIVNFRAGLIRALLNSGFRSGRDSSARRIHGQTVRSGLPLPAVAVFDSWWYSSRTRSSFDVAILAVVTTRATGRVPGIYGETQRLRFAGCPRIGHTRHQQHHRAWVRHSAREIG